MLSIEVRPVAILGPLQVKIVIIIIKALRYKRIINSGKKVISKNKVMNKKKTGQFTEEKSRKTFSEKRFCIYLFFLLISKIVLFCLKSTDNELKQNCKEENPPKMWDND